MRTSVGINIQRILFPTDFSDRSKAAEKYACDLAEEFGAELHVLHVLRDLFLAAPQTAAALLIPPKALDDVVNHANAEIAKLPTSALPSGRRVVRAVRSGSTYDSIVQYAKEYGIDLIIMGTHGRTGIGHAVFGSVAENIVRRAPCSVLTVRLAPNAPS